jgi:hypothetical protein
MKSAFAIIIFAILLGYSEANDLECNLRHISKGELLVDIRNASNQDIILRCGDEGDLVLYGIVCISDSTGKIKIISGGIYSSRKGSGLVLLPPGYHYGKRIKEEDIRNLQDILHLRIGCEYLGYREFHLEMKKNESGDFSWKSWVGDVIFKKSAIENLGMFYGFGLGLSGYNGREK